MGTTRLFGSLVAEKPHLAAYVNRLVYYPSHAVQWEKTKACERMLDLLTNITHIELVGRWEYGSQETFDLCEDSQPRWRRALLAILLSAKLRSMSLWHVRVLMKGLSSLKGLQELRIDSAKIQLSLHSEEQWVYLHVHQSFADD